MPIVHAISALLGNALLLIAAGVSGMALLAVLFWRLRGASPSPDPELKPPITVLKPLCGAEPDLYTQLRSFCQQDYPDFQIIFGVRDPADSALAVVQRLVEEFPSLAIDVVVNSRQHGDNYKISNLMNMFDRARHDVLVIADSDALVAPDYLRVVTAPLADPGVGLVTCVYRGVPTATIWSRLGAMYVNEWFVPSVLLAWLFGQRQFASGQTLCLRRDTLQAIGGLRAIGSHLADDFRLGELVRGLGQRIELSHYEVEVKHHEPSAAALLRHELRWMRTLRVVKPRSFRAMFFSFSLPLAMIGILLVSLGAHGAGGMAWLLFAFTVAARLALHVIHRLRGGSSILSDLWLVPARDLLLSWIWCRSFANSSIIWRGNEFDVDAHGMMRRTA
jgi:ceramide glucosyltransferase